MAQFIFLSSFFNKSQQWKIKVWNNFIYLVFETLIFMTFIRKVIRTKNDKKISTAI